MDEGEFFGTYLKKERELRSITLEELVENTNIKRSYLEAIESGHLEKLPGMTFAKGYLRTYSNYIGLDPHAVLLRFEEYLSQLGKGSQGSYEASSLKRFWITAFLLLSGVALGIILWLQR